MIYQLAIGRSMNTPSKHHANYSSGGHNMY